MGGWQGPRRGRKGGREPISQRDRIWPWGKGSDAQPGGLCGLSAHRGARAVGSPTLLCCILTIGWCAAGSRGHLSLPSPWVALCVTCVTWRPSLGHFPRETSGLTGPGDPGRSHSFALGLISLSQLKSKGPAPGQAQLLAVLLINDCWLAWEAHSLCPGEIKARPNNLLNEMSD